MNVLKMGRVLPGVALLCLFSSCGSNHSKQDAYAPAADSTAYEYAYNSDSAKILKEPKERLMVRQAEMNFKVKELQKTSQKISSITAYCGGEVWNSHLQTEIQNTISKKISADSLLQVITYRQTNEFMIRVPSRNLDSLLVKLEALSLLLHDKKVTTENVSLDYLSNELKSKNIARTQNLYENKMDSKKANIEQYTTAQYDNINMQNSVVDKKIENLAMMDKVNLSTVKVSIYQDTEAQKSIVADLHSDRFDPGFGSSSLMAVQDGWEFILGVIIFLLRIWPMYFFGAGVFFLIKYLEKFKVKSKVPTLGYTGLKEE